MAETYRAQRLHRFGREHLALERLAAPLPGPGRVLIRLRACSLNYRDLVVIDGSYKPDMALPITPLSDGSGEVVAVGAGVSRFAVGDRATPVYTRGWTNGPATLEQRTARTLGGPFDGVAREMIEVSEDDAVRSPATLDDREAATLPIAALTAWTALKEGGARPGVWALTMGVGGVALFALQFAKLFGAQVVALTSTPEKAALLTRLGADLVVNYRETPAWGAAVKRATGGGVAIAVETVGATLPQTLEAMAFQGHVAMIGFLGAKAAELDIRRMIGGVVRVQGVATGSRTGLEELIRAVDLHRLKPVVDAARFELADLPAALGHMAGGGHIGKIVLDIA